MVKLNKIVDLNPEFTTSDEKSGSVTLVGFGPGDPELLTVKGHKALSNADVIFYDDLIDKDYIQCFKGEKIYVGKRKNHHSKDQEQINQLLLQAALKGKNVVRLKGGDPMIFGHGGEEIEFLEKHHIQTAVVPGVSSGIAAAGLTKIPLTYRGISSSVTLISGHPLKNVVLPKSGTLVFYMSVTTIQQIALKLISEGWEADTPAVVIYSVSNSDQQEIFTTLNQLVYSGESFKTPSIIIVGEVVRTGRNNKAKNWELLESVSRLVG